MTRDDIMKLVNQTAGYHWMDEAHIQRFAALVAAAEREACAKVCDFEVRRLTAIYEPRPALAVGICATVIRARGQPTQQDALNAWAEQKLARHGIPMPDDENPSF